jgi:uncharacterized protein YaiE (UPF0345 family)
MADVTINELTRGTPAGNNILPYSTGSSTLGVPVSAIFQNAGSLRPGPGFNIGIGTTKPIAKLQVGDDWLSTDGASTMDPGAIKIYYQIDRSPRIELNHSIPGGAGGPSGAGIGFTLASDNQYDALATRGSAMAVPDPNTERTLAFYISDGIKLTERMRIDSNGRVGIGTANPTAKLDVVGDVKSTNTPKAWVNFDGINGSVVAGEFRCNILKNYNIDRVVRTTTGRYTVYFATPAPDAYYVVTGACNYNNANTDSLTIFTIGSQFTNYCQVVSRGYGSTAGYYDPSSMQVVIHY